MNILFKDAPNSGTLFVSSYCEDVCLSGDGVCACPQWNCADCHAVPRLCQKQRSSGRLSAWAGTQFWRGPEKRKISLSFCLSCATIRMSWLDFLLMFGVAAFHCFHYSATALLLSACCHCTSCWKVHRWFLMRAVILSVGCVCEGEIGTDEFGHVLAWKKWKKSLTLPWPGVKPISLNLQLIAWANWPWAFVFSRGLIICVSSLVTASSSLYLMIAESYPFCCCCCLFYFCCWFQGQKVLILFCGAAVFKKKKVWILPWDSLLVSKWVISSV